MLSSSVDRTSIRSYTSSSVTLTSGPFLGNSQGQIQLCCDGSGVLYVSNGGFNYYSINPVTAVVTAGLASAYGIDAISVTLAGVVFFASGGPVYAVGGAYGATPVLLFSPTGGVYMQCFYVNSTGTAVYCYDSNGGSLCKYTQWSGGTATRTVMTTTSAVTNGYTTISGTDGGMIATGVSSPYQYIDIIPQWFGPISALNGSYITDYNGRVTFGYGVAIDSDMSPIYVTGANPSGVPRNDGAAVLFRAVAGTNNEINIPITAWAPYGVAVHPLTRAIYVISFGLSGRADAGAGVCSNITTLTPNF